MILALLLACGPKINPLEPMVQQIAQARTAGPDAHPHLRFKLAESTVQELVLEILNPDKPIIVPVMIGTVASISVDLEPPRLVTRNSAACDCTVAEVDARGTLDVNIAGLLGKQVLAKDLGVRASLRGAPTFVIRTDAAGVRQIQMEGNPREPWSVDLQLDEEKGFLTNKLIDGQVERPIAAALAKPIPLARLPETMPIELAKIELEEASDLQLGVWFVGEPSQPAPSMDVDSGWGASITDSGVTALLRAVIATQQQHKTYKLEPLDVRLRGERFEADVRVHRRARRVQYRDYIISGRVDSSDAGFTVVPETVVETAAVGWGGSLTGGIVRGQVRKRALEAKIEIPRTFESKEARFPTRWTIRTLEGSERGVFVRGDLEILPPPTAE